MNIYEYINEYDVFSLIIDWSYGLKYLKSVMHITYLKYVFYLIYKLCNIS